MSRPEVESLFDWIMRLWVWAESTDVFEPPPKPVEEYETVIWDSKVNNNSRSSNE